MAVYFKVFDCRAPKELFSGIRSFRIHELSPPDGIVMHWTELGRSFFPFKPRAGVWYHRPKPGSAATGRFSLFGTCRGQHPNTKLVVEVR